MTVSKTARQILSLLVVVVLLLGVTACSQSTISSPSTSPTSTQSSEFLSSSALAQELALAIDGSSDIQTVYQAIPERQRTGVTPDHFQRYILLLRRGVPGRIVSLVAMNDSQNESIRQQILDRLPDQQALVDRTIGYWLNIRDSGIIGDRIEIYCQIDEQGMAYLDANWLEKILAINDFSNLYFDAIDHQDTESLSELLRYTHPDPLARTAIATRLNWFYRNQVETTTSEFRLQTIRIDGLSYGEKLLSGIGNSASLTREIEFIPQTPGVFLVDDLLPSELNLQDTDLVLDDETLIRVGGDSNAANVTLYSVSIEAIIGRPAIHDETTCILQDDGKSLIRLSYEGLDLVIEGNCYNGHSRWRGRVLSATLTNDKFSLGSGLKVGMAAADLYAQYPFISVGDKAATGHVESGEAALTASVENGTVTSLQLTLNDN